MANPRRVEMLQRQILRSIANTVQFDLHDPRVTTRITFTRVKLSRDLSHAKVYYSVLGTDGDKKTAERFLTHARGRIRGALGDNLSTRVVPDLTFLYDPAIEGSIAISETLRKLAEEREANEKEHPEEFPPGYDEGTASADGTGDETPADPPADDDGADAGGDDTRP